jgi:DNA-binding transcriptional LysR family regulator
MALLELGQVAQEPIGALAVTFPFLIEDSVLGPALKQLRTEYPRISYRVDATETPRDLIEENLDVAIHVGDLKDSGYRALPIGWMKEVLCAAPDFLMRSGAPITPKELEQQDWVQSTWQPGELALALCHEPNKRQSADFIKLNPTKRVICSAMSSSIEMAVQGMGYVLLPEFAANRCIKHGQLVRVLPDYQGQWWPFHFVHPYQKEKPKYLERFYELIKYYFDKGANGPGGSSLNQ